MKNKIFILLFGFIVLSSFASALTWYPGFVYYTFDNDTKGYLNDSASSMSMLNLSGSTNGYPTGVSATLLNGSQYVSGTRTQRATVNLTSFASVKTIDFWYKETDVTANQVIGVSAGLAANDDNNQFEFNHYNGDGGLNFYFVVGASVKCNLFDSNTTLSPANVWHHMVITGIGSRFSVFLDNRNLTKFNCSSTQTIPNDWNLVTGNFRTTGHYEADVIIDNLFLSTSDYTTNNVTASYNAGAGLKFDQYAIADLSYNISGIISYNSTAFSGANVSLFNDTNNVVLATTTSNGSGYYIFSSLVNASYYDVMAKYHNSTVMYSASAIVLVNATQMTRNLDFASTGGGTIINNYYLGCQCVSYKSGVYITNLTSTKGCYQVSNLG